MFKKVQRWLQCLGTIFEVPLSRVALINDWLSGKFFAEVLEVSGVGDVFDDVGHIEVVGLIC